MNKKQIITIILAITISLLGLLWFLQGSDLVHIKPLLCFANCQPIPGKSLQWQITGIITFVVSMSIVLIIIKRSHKTKI